MSKEKILVSALLLLGCVTSGEEEFEQDPTAADALYATETATRIVDQGFLLIGNNGAAPVQTVDTTSPMIAFTFATARQQNVQFAVSEATRVEIQKLSGSVWSAAYVLARTSTGTWSSAYTLDGTYRIVITRSPDTDTVIDAHSTTLGASCPLQGTTQSLVGTRYSVGPVRTATPVHLLRSIGSNTSANSGNRARIAATLRFATEPSTLAAIPSSYSVNSQVTALATATTSYVVAQKTGFDGANYDVHYVASSRGHTGLIFRRGTPVPVLTIENGSVSGCSAENDGGVRTDAGDAGVVIDAASDTAVDTMDPFSSASCSGTPWTTADAQALIGSGRPHAQLGEATIMRRERTCDTFGNCQPWRIAVPHYETYLTYSGGVTTRYSSAIRADTVLIAFGGTNPRVTIRHVTDVRHDPLNDTNGLVFAIPMSTIAYPTLHAWNEAPAYEYDYRDLYNYVGRNGTLNITAHCARFSSSELAYSGGPAVREFAAVYRF